MPVQLPQQPAGVVLPALPQDPPIVDVGVDDSARADVYKKNVILAHPAIAAAPAWFLPAMTAILDPILAPIQITLAQTRNYQLHDGSFIPFVIVPFKDGSMPTQPPHNLPPLVNAAAIRVLTADQSTAYAVGYALGNVDGAPARRAAIGRAVGCTVAI